ncbi:MAG: undecaprenyl-diphosphate phosphatase [Fimbriimonadaceae bacterium]
MDLVQAVILGIVQGITEWLPISSTAHLRVVPALFGWDDPGSAFTAVIQLGTILAVVLYFWSDLVRYIGGWLKSLFGGPKGTVEAKMGWGVFVGTLPILFAGYFGREWITGPLRSLNVIAGSLIGFGLIMFAADRLASRQRDMEQVDVRDGLVVGLFQVLSLIPGVSRSGSTMTGAFLRGFDRPTAARFSFLLSLPSITAAGLFQLYDERDMILRERLLPVLVATAVSFVVGYASIAWLIRYLQRHGLGAFVAYRILLGILLIVLVQTGTVPADAAPAAGPAPAERFESPASDRVAPIPDR